MNRIRHVGVLWMALWAFGCGGGGGGAVEGGGGTGNGGATANHAIGGTVTGLTGTVVVQNNGGDNLSVSANGSFVFVTQLAPGTAYSVTVLTQPVGQTCVVANGSGTANAAVANVAISCAAAATGLPAFAHQAYLKASNPDAEDLFGYAVALSGDTLAVGAYVEASAATGVNGNQADNSKFVSGAVYIFVRSGGVWSQQAYLKASNTDRLDKFGAAIALSGDTLAVAAESESSNARGVNGNQADNSATDSGAVYVFTRSAGVWSQQAYLKASNTGAYHRLGRSIALEADTLVVGAMGEYGAATGVNGNQADQTAQASGAAYVFVRSGTTWSQQAYLKASNTEAADQFGSAVALSGNTVAISAPSESSDARGVNGDQANNRAPRSGAVYIFTRSASTWSQQAYVKASNTSAEDGFGSGLALSGDTLAVGSPGEENGFVSGGAVYVFTRINGAWTQQARLTASNADVGTSQADWFAFGSSIALDGDTLAVGAPGENSNATGVNGDQRNTGAHDSGAAYLFARSAGNWTQQAYLKASNTNARDGFGHDLALGAGTMVVGAPREDGSAPGVDGAQGDNGAADAGAVYVFTRP